MASYTIEPFFDSHLLVCQPAHGYRFSMDSLVLAAHICPAVHSRILDVGCGCGIISLLMLHQYQAIQMIGIDIQEDFVCVSRKNAQSNGMADRFQALHQDISHVSCGDIGGVVDIVVSNPPYKKKGTGRISSNRQNALARHEITMDVQLLCGKAAELTGVQGCMAVIFPVERLNELKQVMKKAGFFVHRRRFIYTGTGREAQLVLVSGCKVPGSEVEFLPDLHIFDGQGRHSAEYNALISNGRAWHSILSGKTFLS